MSVSYVAIKNASLLSSQLSMNVTIVRTCIMCLLTLMLTDRCEGTHSCCRVMPFTCFVHIDSGSTLFNDHVEVSLWGDDGGSQPPLPKE
jgi:hypothetical protein